MRRGRAGERGIALIAVLWVTLLLGIIAATFMREARTGVNLARNTVGDAQAEALADAGIHWAMAGMLTTDETAAIRADSTPYAFALEGGSVRVTVQDEGGKVDLNRASEEILRGMFMSAGADLRTATRIAEAVADFRDPDHEPHAQGAEDPDYARAEALSDAKDAPLAVIDELQQVLGVTPELYARVEAIVTVHSPRDEIDLSTAPVEVLRALPDMTEQQIEEILAARQIDAQREPTEVATITTEATTLGGGRFVRRVVVRRGTNPLQPFEILDWRRVWTTTGR